MSHPLHWTPKWPPLLSPQPPPPGVSPAEYGGYVNVIEPIYGLAGTSTSTGVTPPLPKQNPTSNPYRTPVPALRLQQHELTLPPEATITSKRCATHQPSLSPTGLYIIKARMRTLHDLLLQLVEVMKECRPVPVDIAVTTSDAEKNQNDQAFMLARQEAERCKIDLASLQAKLTPENLLAVTRKTKRAQKHKIWEQNKAKKAQEGLESEELRREKLHAAIDRKWARKLDREKKRERTRRFFERTNEENRRVAREALQEKQMLTLLHNLGQLRMLRRERLKREGHLFPEEDQEFFDRVKKEEENVVQRKMEEEERLEKKKAARKAKIEAKRLRFLDQSQRELQPEQPLTGQNIESCESLKEEEGTKRQRTKRWINSDKGLGHTDSSAAPGTICPVQQQELTQGMTLEDEQNQQQQHLHLPREYVSVSKELEGDQRDPVQIQRIRGLWSEYIVDPGSADGTCISLDLGNPVSPSSHFWEALILSAQ
ncbi:hypothetical protein BG004_006197 [Podila humilis]|nr:hypothetical protein BG004_006197 [Podila humilis]